MTFSADVQPQSDGWRRGVSARVSLNPRRCSLSFGSESIMKRKRDLCFFFPFLKKKKKKKPPVTGVDMVCFSTRPLLL